MKIPGLFLGFCLLHELLDFGLVDVALVNVLLYLACYSFVATLV